MNLRAGSRPLLIGHRGAAALEPENTLRSLQRAVELGCDLVEFDVLDLHDGTLVLAHSDDLVEVSHGAAGGTVRSLPLAELREVAPDLPTFDEALELLGRTGAGLHVDVKWRGYEEAVVGAIRRHGLVERTVVSTFLADSLRRFATLEPKLARGFTYPFDRHGIAQRRLLRPVAHTLLAGIRSTLPRRLGGMLAHAQARAAMLHYTVVTPATVARAHELGAPVLAWTVDDPADLRRVLDAGVDGVITNDPRILERGLHSRA